MDRVQRWGTSKEQRGMPTGYEKHPQHARVPLRVLQCADCLRRLSEKHPHSLGDRCVACWQALLVVERMEEYG
jgi:hypothetical protein